MFYILDPAYQTVQKYYLSRDCPQMMRAPKISTRKKQFVSILCDEK